MLVLIDMKRAVISITEVCNLKCLHCYNGYKRANIVADYFNEDFVQQLLSTGIQQIVISGGEPTIKWDLLLSILKTINNRLAVVITSNGITLSREKIYTLMRYNVSKLQISIDGASADTHDYLRGPGSYQKAYEMVKAFPSFITPMFTIHAKNYHEIEPFIEQQIANGIKKIGFERYVPINTNYENKNLILSKEQLCVAFDSISKYHGIEFHINDPLYNTYLLMKNQIPIDILQELCCNLGCQALHNNIYIDAKGDVYACVFSKEKLFNVHSAPLSDCNSKTNPMQSECLKCEYYKVCKGCRAAALYQAGDWLKKDPLCPLQ